MSDNIITITDFMDPNLDVYARLTENQLLNRANPKEERNVIHDVSTEPHVASIVAFEIDPLLYRLSLRGEECGPWCDNRNQYGFHGCFCD
jgi:hypothetical protein